MNAEGSHIYPGYGVANRGIRGEQITEERRVSSGVRTGEEEESDVRISELFERAELGHPFGYRRDVNLLMDVICDRLSSRLCHRCVRQTCNQTCPRLSEISDSCQCQETNGTASNLSRLVQGREEITQTTSHRCESCNVILCDRANARETVLAESRGSNHPDPETFNKRRMGFLKSRAFLEQKFKQGMAEKARQLSLSSAPNKTLASHKFGDDLLRHPPGACKANFYGTPGSARVQTEKPVYIEGTNPFLDQLKFELQNDEDTKQHFANIYQKDYPSSPQSNLPYETPLEFENRTVGATRHMHASPVDLLRKRISHYDNGSKWAPKGNLEYRVQHNKQTKMAGESPRRWTVEEYGRNDERSSEELMEVDPSIHHQVVSLIPRATGQKNGRCNALVGFADKMSQEAMAEGPTYKHSSALWKQTYEKLFGRSSSSPTSTVLQSLQKKKLNLNPKEDRASEERGIQAVPSAHVAETQTNDGSGSSIQETSMGQQTTETGNGAGIKAITSIGIGNIDSVKIHADVCTQTSKTSQESVRQQPFSLNMWTQTRTLPRGTEPITLPVPRKTTGHQPIHTHYSSDWSPVSESDNEDALPMNPKNTVKFYKQSFKKLKKKFVGGKDASSSDSDVDTRHRVGRVLGSSRDASTDSWYNMDTSSHSQLHGQPKTTHTRSFQYAHPVLRDVLCLEKPPQTDPSKFERVNREESPVHSQNVLWCYDECDMAAFFELHHLDVPISLRKKKGKRNKNKSDDERSGQVIAVKKEDIKQEQTGKMFDEEKFKRPVIPQSPPPTMKQKPEFHQGNLNQFEAKEGTRRLSWRDQAHINRKAKFFEVEAEIAGETTRSSVEERKISFVPDTGTVRRISLFEGMARH
ncbi:uncharacterized protein LOC135156210 [Lytechinus pictus]|uniref:uncharacterized protein LOC135156210 n=1 Tax=Lytechinus pictus TaxID=7653 RepID=UPI0030B9F534